MGVLDGEVLDATFMSKKELCAFYEKEMKDCKEKDILLSLHLKATMMKVSDPILFGHCVSVFFKDVFEKHAAVFAEIGVNVNNGFGDVVAKVATLPADKKAEIEADIEAAYASRPRLAMVNSDKGITNLHVPSDMIIDASMPAMIRGMDGLGGGMWTPDSKPGARDSHLEPTKALIPDRCYAGVFKVAVDFCKANGAFDVSTMGTVPKHVEQFVKENHLRWDSLGEFLALAPAIEDIGTKGNNPKALVLADCLNTAVAKFLDENKSPGRKKMEIDNRGSHFYLALYWAQALAAQTTDADLQGKFTKLAKTLSDNEAKINQALIDCQGGAIDIGGYYHPDHKKVSAAMRPSKLFNDALDALK